MDPALRESRIAGESLPPLDEKVAFLSRPQSYPGALEEVVRRETNMSWVFLAGERAYKLKKPVRLPYLDFSTLARREAASRAELRLNRRLAQGIYLDVVPLRLDGALSIGGKGRTVDWLIVMRRLDEKGSLERAILDGRAGPHDIDGLARLLARFYRRARPVRSSAAEHLLAWRRSLLDNRRILMRTEFGLPRGQIARIDRAQQRFLDFRHNLLAGRPRNRRIVDGHGDLRPEHIWLDSPGVIIDCLEFNAHLRSVDPFDEIAFLSVECERLGAGWIGERMKRRLAEALHDPVPEALFDFYRCYRASLRARLSIAHLLLPNPRTPEKWPRLARRYLEIAEAAAKALERHLNSREERSILRSG